MYRDVFQLFHQTVHHNTERRPAYTFNDNNVLFTLWTDSVATARFAYSAVMRHVGQS